MAKIKIMAYRCERCEHIWMPRVYAVKAKENPHVCPRCKSPYWNVPRKVIVGKAREVIA